MQYGTWCCVLASGITTDVMLFHQHGGRLVHQYRIYADPLPHVSLQGPVMKRLTQFTNQASAVARLTILKEQMLRSAGADTKLDRRGHLAPDLASPARRAGRTAACRTAATVTFPTRVEIIASTPTRSTPVDGSASPDLLKPTRRFSLPQHQFDVTVAPPAYVLFPMDGGVPLSTSPVSTVPVPPGFAPIISPGSLALPPVSADPTPPGFAAPVSPVSMFVPELLSPSPVQPAFNESREI